LCQSLLGIHPILSYIDTIKLLFLQKLCSLDDNFITKRIFTTRLFSYFADNSRKHFGFIPDIIGILYHYELSDYLVEYLLQGISPPQQLWKPIVYGAVNEAHSNEWSLHTMSDNHFRRFRDIHRSVELANVWKYAKSSRILKIILFIVKLMTDIPNNTKGICVYVTDSFLTYLFMPVVVVPVPNSYRKLGYDYWTF
jgi:hypothetical protein